MAWTLLTSLTSALKKNASLHSAAVFSPASTPMSATHTLAPSLEKRSAASRPMPLAAPVITATLPSSRPINPPHPPPKTPPPPSPLALVAGPALVELRLFSTREVEVVVDDVVAERLARHLSFLQRGDGVAQRVRESLHVGFVRVAFELGRHLELLLDAVQARRQQGRECQIWVDVSAGDAGLCAQVLAVADDPEPARSVVVAPRERRRRPRPCRIALVRVDVRSQEDRQLRRACDVARKVPAERLRLTVECVAIALPQARMHMARAADPTMVGLGHERHRAALLVGHLLDAVLVDDVVVGHGQRVREMEVDLLLTRPRFALRALDTDAGRLHPIAHRPDEWLVVARGEHVVVEVVRHRWGQA